MKQLFNFTPLKWETDEGEKCNEGKNLPLRLVTNVPCYKPFCDV